MGMVYTARPYVICIIVNKSNLVKHLLRVSLLHMSKQRHVERIKEILIESEERGERPGTRSAVSVTNPSSTSDFNFTVT